MDIHVGKCMGEVLKRYITLLKAVMRELVGSTLNFFHQNVYMYVITNTPTVINNQNVRLLPIPTSNESHFLFPQGFLPNLTMLRWHTLRLSFATHCQYPWSVTISVTLGTWEQFCDLLLGQAAAKCYSPKVRSPVTGWIRWLFVVSWLRGQMCMDLVLGSVPW